MTDSFDNFLKNLNLNEEQREKIIKNSYQKKFKKSSRIFSNDEECKGLVFVCSGALRVFIASNRFYKEINLFTLNDEDYCLLTASCIFKNINFDINIEFVKDTLVWILPTDRLNELSLEFLELKEFQLELMSKRFSEVMNFLEDFAFKPLNERIIDFLNTNKNENNEIKITHEELAKSLGSTREVVSRILKDLQNKNKLQLKRGFITLIKH